ncbi:MAG: hypothetical protein C0P74_014370 [Gammaproteobacteria bacterium]
MAKVKDIVVRFRQSVSPDVVVNRIRVRPANTPAAYDTPYDDVTPPPPDADGYTRIPAANIPSFAGLEGQFDVHITAVDARGNESDFLEIDNQTFDLSPPEAPTDGSIE